MALSDAASLFSVTPNPNADDPSQIVLEATRALLADPRLDTVLPKLLQLARQYIPADAHAVWRHFAAEERWAVLASAGLSKNYQNQFEPAGQTITETVIVPDIKKLPPLVERRRVHYEAEGIRALVVAPIRLRAGVGGTLVFYFHQPHEFSTHELKLVDTLADLAALAIETAESYEALEREKTHSQLLAEASAILSSSLDYEKTLASMARIAVPGIADWCAIDVQEDDHSIRRLAVQHADPAKVRFVLEMGDRYPPDEHYGVQQVFRSGHSILAPELTDEMLQIVAREPEHLDMLRAIGMKSAMLVPLIAHQRTLGVITLVMAESGRHFNQNDLKFVEDLARRAAVAVDNALLHTQLQTSERELASAVELLGLAQEASRVATWEWNMLTGELRWGPGSAPVFGVSSKELTTINETRNRIHPEDRELVFQQVDLAEQPPEAYDSQFRVIWPDGSIRWLSGRGRVVLGESGQATKMLGLCMDITERKVAETALKEREEQFRTLADSIPQLAWMANPDGSVFWYNQRWYDYSGTTLDQMQGWGWRAVHHPEHVDRVVEKFRDCINQGEAWEDTFPLRSQRGEYRWFLSRALPIRDERGRIVRWFGTNTDVTEQREIREALRLSNERLDAALAASQTGTFRWNSKDSTFLEFGNSLKRLFGLSPDESIVTTADFVRHVHPDDVPAIMAAVEQCHRGADFEMEYRILMPDGSIRWLYDRAKAVPTDNGDGFHLVGACTDITRRKLADDILKQANEDLETRVKERTEDLQRAEAALRALSTRLLQSQDEERRRIARELHDSLGQHLTAAKINIDIAAATVAEQRLQELLRQGQAEIDRSIREIRTLSHLLHPPLLEEAGLPSALGWYVDGFSERSGIPVTLELDPDLGRLSRELETTIFRLVQEALTNVHRHSGSTTATIRILRQAGEIRVEIYDRGKGMPLSENGNLGVRPGVGIQGMRERVRLLGGIFEIQSSDQGTVVRAVLPISIEKAPIADV